jgi:hypothetical protein
MESTPVADGLILADHPRKRPPVVSSANGALKCNRLSGMFFPAGHRPGILIRSPLLITIGKRWNSSHPGKMGQPSGDGSASKIYF